MKRLYECRLELTYYALSADPGEARRYVAAAVRDAYLTADELDVGEVCPGDPRAAGWTEASAVYHEGSEEILLGTVWPQEEPDMTESELTALRTQFIAALRAQDWDYEYSDDYTAYQAGKAGMDQLHRMVDQLPDGVQLWNAYAPVGRKIPVPGV